MSRITLLASLALGGCGDDEPAESNIAATGGTGGGSGGASGGGPSGGTGGSGTSGAGGDTSDPGPCTVNDGECIFRHDTFGDEQLWTDTLRLNEVVQAMTPTAALELGLKVDSEAVPADVLANADLTAAATTVALLGLNAVVGVRAQVTDGMVTSIGITCALCHSTVDDSALPGVGKRLDGWPNRDLDPGKIIAATPGLSTLATALDVPLETLRTALESWGPGRYDARFNQDKMSAPVLIPPAYGLADVALETYTGEGPISYWNAYVAVTQMGAQGDFSDPELGIDINHDPDLLTSKLPALRDYQFSLLPPPPPADSFDAAAAARGEALFTGKAECSSCHSGASFSDSMLYAPAVVGQDATEAERSKTGMYRTTPLKGAWQHPPYFHDGSAAMLSDVIEHYNTEMDLMLTGTEIADLEQYLLSL
jgi:mono/diheme cytochrome c family protein